jgi:glyoxylase-like metal-dependent hydrolase (beta-lactamase superfamily II)
VVFDHDYTLTVGEQTLVLSDKGPNHSAGNLFIYAPAQKVLMLVDVVYPGYMPYPNLGVTVDVHGYESAHRQALTYDFTDFIGGHVDRLGTRADVQTSLDFVRELRVEAAAALGEEPFPAFLQRTADRGSQTWFAHDDYERERVDACYRHMFGRWDGRLKGADRFLRSHCWTMIVALAVDVQADDGRHR